MDSDEVIKMGHGAGGRLMRRLIADVFAGAFGTPELAALDDSALVSADGDRLAFTTDSYVVRPLFFPGGDIGKLAVCGTVNDLAVTGARPVYLTCSFIIEEGFPVVDLKRVVSSMAAAACEAGVSVVAGDTKVVERGAADGLFVTTSGIGIFPDGRKPARRPVKPGDAVLINGAPAVHGIAVVLAREEFNLAAAVESDCAPLNGLIDDVLAVAPNIAFMRDATRGGVAAVLNEIAAAEGVVIEIDEVSVPRDDTVESVCELLGYDPFYIANEGKVIIICPAEEAESAMEAIKRHEYGKDAAIIGRVEEGTSRVIMETAVGGARILDMPLAEQLPRIC
ncbi:MAG: hydrogenase expression/formation protein HypE [Candidatus Coatesbacteria bacterium]|nr:MAG: hydrogenase expression/formation protein HypE [Candidatus Coatesbacteria bacterium]